MLSPGNQKPTIAEYQDAVGRLKEARAVAVEQHARAEAGGDIVGGERSLSDLRAALDEFREIRSRLSQEDLFIVEFNVEVLGDRKVGFTIPSGISHGNILYRIADLFAQQSREFPIKLVCAAWSSQEDFTTVSSRPQRVQVFGCVDGSSSMNASEQKEYLMRRGLEMCSRADLVIAAYLYSFVSGQNMFEGVDLARTMGGDVGFMEDFGYIEGSSNADDRDSDIVAAGRLPQNSPFKSLCDLPPARYLDKAAARVRAALRIAGQEAA